MMEIARAEQKKWGETRFRFTIELFDQTRRRGKAKLRPPLAQIQHRQAERLANPGIVKIQVIHESETLSAGIVDLMRAFSKLRAKLQ